MSDLMSRIKVTIDIPDEVKRALGIYSAENNVTIGQLVAEMVRDYMPDHVKRAEQAIATGRPTLTRKGRPKKTKP